MRIEWDAQGQKQYEKGVSRGVLYKYDKTNSKWKGYGWNGLISVTESPDGADETELWADNIKYGSMRSAEKFNGTIEAYTYPAEFEGCDGMAAPVRGVTLGQQARETFCLCYRTEIANDQNPEAGYKLHIVYNATCSPSDKQYETINDNPDAITFDWDFTTTPINVTGFKPTSHITIDSRDFSTEPGAALLKTLEDKLYGVNADDTATPPVVAADPELPLPNTILSMLGYVAS